MNCGDSEVGIKTKAATPRKSRVFTRHDLHQDRSPLDESHGIHLIKAAVACSPQNSAALVKLFLFERAWRRRRRAAHVERRKTTSRAHTITLDNTCKPALILG